MITAKRPRLAPSRAPVVRSRWARAHLVAALTAASLSLISTLALADAGSGIQMLPPVDAASGVAQGCNDGFNRVLTWDGLSTVKCSGTVKVDKDGNVGILGNVGVGTLNPAQPLDVNGGIAVEGVAALLRDGAHAYLFPSGTGYSDNAVYVGGYATTDLSVSGNIYATGSVTVGPGSGYYHSSDARLKDNIQTVHGLDLVTRLRGVSFDWKKGGQPDMGVIAQELERVIPSAVHTDGKGFKSVEYDQLIAPMIEAIKEQNAEIKALRSEVASLRQEVEK